MHNCFLTYVHWSVLPFVLAVIPELSHSIPVKIEKLLPLFKLIKLSANFLGTCENLKHYDFRELNYLSILKKYIFDSNFTRKLSKTKQRECCEKVFALDFLVFHILVTLKCFRSSDYFYY